MRAMIMTEQGRQLELVERVRPRASGHGLVVRVEACGVCRTDLHVWDGELEHPRLPIILGHQIVGVVEEMGEHVSRFRVGERIGIPWLGKTCGVCRFCQSGRENLCDEAEFTGYQIDGGFAEFAEADSRYAFSIPSAYQPAEAAPLLCAGLIGYRSLKMTGPAKSVGLYGFGAAGHIVAQIALYQGRKVLAFTRPGDERGQAFACSLGVTWAGGSDQRPPFPMDAAIIFAPEGALVPVALASVDKGGVVVCAGIHMSDVPAFPYSLLWQERRLVSVANLTRQDGEEFFELAPKIPIAARVTQYELENTQQALDDLRAGRIDGAAVVRPPRSESRQHVADEVVTGAA
jgi:propanol-preferring alcohol dehydrogenase